MHGSGKLQLNKDDVLSVLRGALLATGGAVITYFGTSVLPDIDESTTAGAIAAGLIATLLNVLRKYLSDTRA